MTRLLTPVLVTIMALVLGLGSPAQAQSCKNGQCAVTLQSPQSPQGTLQSGMILTEPAYTKQVTVTYPERNFLVTEIPAPKAEAPKRKKFKLKLKKCGG